MNTSSDAAWSVASSSIMPVLPPKSNRRRGTTPSKKQNKADVWKRALDVMGLEPLNEPSTKSASSAFASSSSSASASTNLNPDVSTMTTPEATPGLGEASSSKRPRSILDLPVETQKEIFKHASGNDLIALSLVSKHFRHLAAEQLYRCFSIVFFDDDDPSTGSPIDVLAAGLETFVSSEYDYGSYLKDIYMEPVAGGEKGERAYRDYSYDTGCGKFMNTLFLLTLRKAPALETFFWDIRVELSRPVFRALHQIRALQHLRIRMHSGPSLYQAPPALPPALPAPGPVHSLGPPPPPPHLPPPPSGWPQGPPPPPVFVSIPSHNGPSMASHHYPPTSSNSFAMGNKYASRIQTKALKNLLPPITRSPPTLSGFKNLKTLEILDMDTLDYTSELRACIRNSSSTLTTMRISFSELLANKSRKPPPEVHSDTDSEVDDEFGQIIPPGPPPPGFASSGNDPTAPSKTIKAQEEKKKQDDVLQKIFGIQIAKKAKPVPTVKSDPEPSAKNDGDPKLLFIKNLEPVAAKLMSQVKSGGYLATEGKKVLEMIEKAAKTYLDSVENAKEKEPQAASDGGSAKETSASSTTSADVLAGEDSPTSGDAATKEAGLFDDKPPKPKKTANADPEVANPDDIDIEEPEGKELTLEIDAPAVEAATTDEASRADVGGAKSSVGEESQATLAEGSRGKLMVRATSLHSTLVDIEQEADSLQRKLDELRERMIDTTPTPTDLEALSATESEFQKVSNRMAEFKLSMEELDEQVEETLGRPEKLGNDKMSEYVRNTRGLGLKTLAIYLIPVKAHILSRAIDLNVLEDITLLNVGPQIPFWNALAKENTISPLPLKKIYTDNVTLQFLAFVSQLENVTELLLLEKQKGRVESTAAKTNVTIEQIRKVVLKKHAGNLKVLMMKNDSGPDWDLNVKTTMLLCLRAKQLEELSVSFGTRSMHTLLQFMPGLTSLRALHTNQFRTEDTCVWVMREFRKFTVDNVAHNPDMKLEYLALDTVVDRLVRRSKANASQKATVDKKGKGKAASNSKVLAEMILGPGGTWPDGGVLNNSGTAGIGPSALAGPLLDMQLSSDEDDDSAPVVGKLGLKIETVDNVRFHDIVGVRIFEKDVIGGRL
ncbi:uncharacterized protein BP5553_06465 [Venustampulla echinocandica]|uniref:F-box domain-containing protein n=1 Tax=Venustampulla echinocandica TaxID=2656787 RepID=A0A370TK05_9HELO|nr:uncharacterized protein BP5553_06465 [Venustampulla echinocandica]RDL35853.1 hypothetical protein BP5553_06465 [Venustampulla echinocandica]